MVIDKVQIIENEVNEKIESNVKNICFYMEKCK